MRLGLDSARGLLAALGDPQRSFPAVLVAGSNGKGSTSALLASMLGAAGYRTGLYTSPHLESVEERLRIDGRTISPARLAGLLERAVVAAEREGGPLPTYFEAVTIAAFLWFAEEAVDVAVLEVGMGGRLDATNLAEPVLSLITSISLEHREHLGDTLALIAREKAGILRSGRPALAWVEAAEAADSLRTVAAERGASLFFAPDRVRIESLAPEGWEGQTVRLATPAGRRELRIALPGAHQAKNLGLAVAAAEALPGLGFGRLDAEAIARGAAACRWPGRLEVVPLPGGRRVLLDAAHNPEGAEVLSRFLAEREIEGAARPDLLLGLLADKDAGEMLAALEPRARHLVLTAPPSPRARDPHEIAVLLSGREGVYVQDDPGAALDVALGLGAETLVICGSIFLVGDLRKRLREKLGVPAAAVESAVGAPYINGS